MATLPEGYELREGADPVAAHAFLTNSYWAKDISLDTVRRSFEGSLQVSVWHDGKQVAMARVISDYATFAYLNDVHVIEDHAGQGIAQAMLDYLYRHPRLQGMRRWILFTKDAQSLYAKSGWKQYPWPERLMIIDDSVKP